VVFERLLWQMRGCGCEQDVVDANRMSWCCSRGGGCKQEIVVVFERLWVRTRGYGCEREVVDVNERLQTGGRGQNRSLWWCLKGRGLKR
jgi:hypothetical protein